MTSVSKNVYANKLDDIVNKDNNTYHGTIKMKPVDVKSKILNLELEILLEYRNIKIYLQKVTIRIGVKKFL